MQGKVLLFNFDEGLQLKAIKMVFFLTQVQTIVVPKENYGVPLKILILDEEIPRIYQKNDKELDGKMMVFAGLSGGRLDKVISLLRANPACGKIPYKAILTDTNQSWNAFALLEELKMEHAAMHDGYE